MNTRKLLKATGLLALGGVVGWIKGVCDTVYCVGTAIAKKEECENLSEKLDELKRTIKGETESVEETAADIAETVSDAAEEVAEAVEDAAKDVIEDITDNQPED